MPAPDRQEPLPLDRGPGSPGEDPGASAGPDRRLQPELHCEAGGQELLPALTSTLYLTYARPRPIVDPPQEVWYKRACAWGAGFGRSATEREVADTILEGLYQFGQRRWRYATCSIQGSSCILGKTAMEPDPVRLHCNSTDQVCKCPWTDLVADPPCNFSDCFVFSQVLQYVGATMGIGGMVPRQVFGLHHKGFATHPKTRSLDPEFAGNLMCGERQAPCSYTFLNHSLRRWGDLFYDATFGNAYHEVGELYFQNVTQVCGNNLIFENGAAVLLGAGYGGLPRYSEKKALASCADAPAPTRSKDLFRAKNPARLGKPKNVTLEWEATESGRPFLRATIPIHVKRVPSALYGIDGRLSRGETTLAYGGRKVEMDSQTSTVTVDFHFAELPAAGMCDLALSLHWLDPVSPLGGLMTEVHLPPLPAVSGDSRRR